MHTLQIFEELAKLKTYQESLLFLSANKYLKIQENITDEYVDTLIFQGEGGFIFLNKNKDTKEWFIEWSL